MKNLFYGLIIIGMLAAIGAVFLAFNARTQAFNDKFAAENTRDEAENKRRDAETKEQAAMMLKTEADKKAAQSDKEKENALEEAKKSNAKAEDAYKERDNSYKLVAEAKLQAQEAIAVKNKAEGERDDAFAKRDEAEGNLKATEEGRLIAEKKWEEENKRRVEIEKERRDIIETVQFAEKIARFCGGMIDKVVVGMDQADQYYLKGLEEWKGANDIKKKTIALGLFTKAKDYYTGAQVALNKVEMINEDTNEIKAFCQDGINENIASVEVIKNLLNQMLKNPQPTKEEIEEKGKDAIKRKLTADNAVLETCNRILGLMDKHINTFPTSRRAQADELKKKIEERLGPEKTGESTSLSEK